MPHPTTLECFHQFVGEQLQLGDAAGMSPDQVLALWHEREASIAAIREGLADVDARRTKSLEDYDRDFRLRHGLDAPE